MDRFDADVMEDLMSDPAEGPALSTMDEGDEYDEYDEGDFGDEGDDPFLGKILGGLLGGGQSADEMDEYDEFSPQASSFDEYDEFSPQASSFDEFDPGDEYDSFEDLAADAMDAADADEFFGRLARIARRVGKGIGSVARVVGPIASAIPIPQAQLIGRVANVAGKLLADGADEFEAIDELVDGLEDDAIDAAAPVIAAAALRRTAVRAAAPAARRAAVRAVSQAVRQAVRSQGGPAARGVVRAVRATRRVTKQRHLPPRTAAKVAAHAARSVARRPQIARRLSRPLVPASRRATPRGRAQSIIQRTLGPAARGGGAYSPYGYGYGGGGGGYGYGPGTSRRHSTVQVRPCAHCAARTLRLRNPVNIMITSGR